MKKILLDIAESYAIILLKISEAANVEIQTRIQDAFEVFDHEHNNTVDVREIGTIIRSLGEKHLIFSNF